MFTGLIEEIGYIEKIETKTISTTMQIKAKKVLDKVKVGDSIATNGACLTVVTHTDNTFTVDIMAETVRMTNIKTLRKGDPVNLERALRLSDRLGGHIVSGHIDGTGVIKEFREEENAIWVKIEASEEILKYIIKKGSITIDGISLTVAKLENETFSVSLIPLTRDDTTLASKKVGDIINLECDIVGKYVERLMGYENKESKDNVTMQLLQDNGFL